MRILFITDSIPYPILGGASLRNYNLLHRLAAENEVWLVAFTKNTEQGESIRHFKEFCAGVEYVGGIPKSAFSDLPNFIKYIFRGIPPELRFFASADLAQKIHRVLSQISFDVIQIDQIYMGLYLEEIPPDQRQRTLWCLHDVDFVKYRRIIQLESKKSRRLRLWLNNQLIHHWEPRYAAKFCRCIAMSALDKQLLLDENPSLKIEIIPNGVDINLFAPMPEIKERHALIFVGNMAYLPCIDAILYFYEQILPIIKQTIPDVELWVVGKDPPEQIKSLNGNVIHITGRVEDVRPYYEQSSVCVVPLRAGGGTRLKILEALAVGRPVVSTSIGCEGLDLIADQEILVADDPSAFAQKTIHLLSNQALRKHIIWHGRQVVESRYDWNLITKRLTEVYQEVRSE